MDGNTPAETNARTIRFVYARRTPRRGYNHLIEQQPDPNFSPQPNVELPAANLQMNQATSGNIGRHSATPRREMHTIGVAANPQQDLGVPPLLQGNTSYASAVIAQPSAGFDQEMTCVDSSRSLSDEISDEDTQVFTSGNMDSEGLIHLIIETMEDEYPLTVNRQILITDLRQEVAGATSTIVEHHAIVYLGTLLIDGCRLSDYGVLDGGRLQLHSLLNQPQNNQVAAEQEPNSKISKIRQAIQRQMGDHHSLRRVIEKRLTKSDINKRQHRISIPFGRVDDGFLTLNEWSKLHQLDRDQRNTPVGVVVLRMEDEEVEFESVRVFPGNLTRWIDKYALNREGWAQFTEEILFTKHMAISIYSFRVGTKLYLAILKD